ncbi:MAG TPA: hypothetical protein VEG62_04750 [Acidimicrobiales bacterium]|nr:hypothetical protein [Acidimicrobiales bacterium]
MTLEVDHSQLALRGPAPADPAVLAAIAAAVDQAWPRPAPADQHDPAHLAWRFSGRWWNKPLPLRRDRPR